MLFGFISVSVHIMYTFAMLFLIYFYSSLASQRVMECVDDLRGQEEEMPPIR